MYIPGTTCLHIPLAHPCLYCFLLTHSILYCTFYLIAHFTPYFILFYFIICSYFYFILTYIYIYSLVLCFIVLFVFILHCPLSGPVLTYISLLIIPCMIVYVTNNKEPWTLSFGSHVFHRNRRWLESLLRDVTGKPSSHWRSLFLCWSAEDVELFVSSCYYFDDVLNASGWCLQPDGKARVQRPWASKWKQRAERREKSREFSAVVVSFNRLISVRLLWASSNQIVLVG